VDSRWRRPASCVFLCDLVKAFDFLCNFLLARSASFENFNSLSTMARSISFEKFNSLLTMAQSISFEKFNSLLMARSISFERVGA